MVAITVLLAAVVIVMLTGAADPDVALTTDTVVRLDPTNAGTELTTDYSGGQEINVQLNGETIATIDGDSTGDTVFLPTAPGDEAHLVAGDDDADVLIRETFDAGEAGDFVASYPLDEDTSDLRDHPLNDNHGQFEGGGPNWGDDDNGTYRDFNGSNDSVNISGLTAGNTNVGEFTVAVMFEADDLSTTRQLVEHNNDDGREWHLETTSSEDLQFAVNYPAANISTDSNPLSEDELHVAVGTYDGETYRLYLDGEEMANGTHDVEIDMERMRIGEDDTDPTDNFQNFDGRMYEFRLYYTSMDDHEVEMLTRAMD